MKTIKNGIGIWMVLAIIALPFPFFILPTIGEGISTFLFPIVHFSTTILGLNISEISFSSDSILYFIQSGLLIIPAFIFILLNRKVNWISVQKLEGIIHLTITYTLVLFLFKYGADKLFKHQFYDAEPNTLFTPVGQLSKDILFWTSMGSSYSYNLFMGLIEIIPALLLLWKRTRLLGVIISIGVLGNILALNFSFDITVKLLSFLLFALSLHALSYYTKSLWGFFVLHQSAEQKTEIVLFSKPIIKRVFKGIIILFIISETFLSFIQSGEYNGDKRIKIENFGAYEIKNLSGESKLFNSQKRFFIHSKGYLITESEDGLFKDYKVLSAKEYIHFSSEKFNLKIIKKENYLLMSWTENGTKNLMKATKIDLKKLPLLKDDFQLYLD